MSKLNKYSTSSEYTIQYKGMGGVDFTSENNALDRGRFSYLENMYRDYEGDGGVMLESVVGFRKLASTDGGYVHSIFSYKDALGSEQIVIHAGDGLYKFPIKEKDLETKTLSKIASIEDSQSSAFRFGNGLYVLDGKDITVIDGNGDIGSVRENLDSLPYIPTCYVNGEEYEQRNLLTNKFCEKFIIGNPEDYARESSELKYEILSEEDGICAVSGATFVAGRPIYIPSRTTIGGRSYRITTIMSGAFENCTEITDLTIANGVTVIEKNAFLGCKYLSSALLPETLEQIGEKAFYSCPSLASVNLGRSIKKIGVDAFSLCTALKSIDYFPSKVIYNK